MREKNYSKYPNRYYLFNGAHITTSTKGEALRKTQPLILRQKTYDDGRSVWHRYDPTCDCPSQKRVDWGKGIEVPENDNYPVWMENPVRGNGYLDIKDISDKLTYLGSFRSWVEKHELRECWGEWTDSREEEREYVKGLVKSAIKCGWFVPREQSKDAFEKRSSMETMNGIAVVGDTILFADEDKLLFTATILSFSEQSVVLECSGKTIRKYLWSSEKYFYKIK